MTIGIARNIANIKELLEAAYDVNVQPLAEVDYSKPDTVAVYIDYSWRSLFKDTLLKAIPFEKRTLLLLEPYNVNPVAYLVPWLRNRFCRVITWDKRLLAKHRDYSPIVVNPFEEPPDYAENRFSDIAFADKKLLVAIAGKRRRLIPLGDHGLRNAVYRHFDKVLPHDFDLYGKWWGKRDFRNVYRGPIESGSAGKVAVMARYRFALCYENNANQPGYVSEKISDCICARCVPIYYGSDGIEERVPPECFINAKQFGSLDEMREFIVSMKESEHKKYVAAMDDFCKSELAKKFTRKHFATMFADAIGLTAKLH